MSVFEAAHSCHVVNSVADWLQWYSLRHCNVWKCHLRCAGSLWVSELIISKYLWRGLCSVFVFVLFVLNCEVNVYYCDSTEISKVGCIWFLALNTKTVSRKHVSQQIWSRVWFTVHVTSHFAFQENREGGGGRRGERVEIVMNGKRRRKKKKKKKS